MKIKLYLILLLAMSAGTAEAGNIIYRDTYYGSGAFWTSPNGKYRLDYLNGYLVQSEVTAYGKIKLWQFPNDGQAIPGSYLSLVTTYDNSTWYETGSHPFDSYKFSIGGRAWHFLGETQVLYDGGYSGRAGALFLLDDGRMHITTEASQPAYIWNSRTSPDDVYGTGTYYACVIQGRNLLFPRRMKDELSTSFMAGGHISMMDQCTVSQAAAPLSFTALEYIELLPGFQTSITGTGAFIAEPLKRGGAGAGTTSRDTEESVPVTPSASKFKIYPNPANDFLHVSLDPGDKLKQFYLFDNTGKQVGRFQNVSGISIGSLPAGMYFYRVETEKNLYTGKIVKE